MSKVKSIKTAPERLKHRLDKLKLSQASRWAFSDDDTAEESNKLLPEDSRAALFDEFPLLVASALGVDAGPDEREQAKAIFAEYYALRGNQKEERGIFDIRNNTELLNTVLCPRQDCTKELKVPGYPHLDRRFHLSRPECCCVKGYEACSNCGIKARLGATIKEAMCPTEYGLLTKHDSDFFKDVKIGRQREAEEDGEASDAAAGGGASGGSSRTTRQRVREEETLREMFTRLIEVALPDLLPHHYTCEMLDTTHMIVKHAYGETTLLIESDFAAVVEHVHSGTKTCAALSHSNVEVMVVSFCPKDALIAGTRTMERKMTTHCWFGIGPTTSKYKEADTAFHHTFVERIMEYYLDELELPLALVVAITDGCKGQYKGRRWFRRIAEFRAQHRGVKKVHLYCATAHGKGYHDALGKLIARLLAKAETYDQARIALSINLYDLAKQTYTGEATTHRGTGMQAIDAFMCCYLTSNKAEYDRLQASGERDANDKKNILYIDRAHEWDVNGIDGSSTVYMMSSGSEDADHIQACELPCACIACRKRGLLGIIPAADASEACVMSDFMEPMEDKTITFCAPPSRKTEERKKMEEARARFATTLRVSGFVVLGIVQKEGQRDPLEPYYVAMVVKKPWKTKKRLDKTTDGVTALIKKDKYVVEIQWLDRCEPGGLEFRVWKEGETSIVEIDGCVQLSGVTLSKRGSKYIMSKEQHRKVLECNLGRFSSYH